jgi:pimeloyl-ACP methyl ester carboxylesterase
VVFISILLYVFIKPDLNTAQLCTDHIHKSGNYIRLRDGRHLQYKSYGPESGFPVLHFHPMSTSRLFSHIDIDQITEELGIRLIITDRPGVGLSSPGKPSRKLLDWGKDIKELLDHLQIDQFSVSGHSTGGPYALAIAYLFPDRVKRVATIGSVVFPTSFGESRTDSYWEDMFDNMKTTNKFLFILAMDHPWLLSILWKFMPGTLTDINQTITEISKSSSESKFFRNTKWSSLLRVSMVESFRQGTFSLYEELTMLPMDWDFH